MVGTFFSSVHSLYLLEGRFLVDCFTIIAPPMRQSSTKPLYLKFPLTRICYHTAVSKPVPQIPIDRNVLPRSHD